MSENDVIRPTTVTVDLAAIRHNVATVRATVGNAGLCPIVKADAYGHGAVPVSRVLSDAGVQWLGVALVEEGLELRRAGIDTPILVLFGDTHPAGNGYRAMLSDAMVPTLWRTDQIEAYAAAADGKDAPFHLEIDTGMRRLGVAPDDVGAFIDALQAHTNLRVDGVLTHLANADLADPDMTHKQLQLFDAACEVLSGRGIRPRWVHAANSAAVLTRDDAHHSLVRPGLMIYGLEPMAQSAVADLRPAMQWNTRVMHVQNVPQGVAVSYGGRWTAPRPSVIATLPVGYADGYPRCLSNRGAVLVAGQRAPVVGSVCMDLLLIDVTDIDGVALYDEVVLMGEQLGATLTTRELADWADTIPYEIICGVGPRVPRQTIDS